MNEKEEWHKITIYFENGTTIDFNLDHKLDMNTLSPKASLNINLSQAEWVNLSKVTHIRQKRIEAKKE